MMRHQPIISDNSCTGWVAILKLKLSDHRERSQNWALPYKLKEENHQACLWILLPFLKFIFKLYYVNTTYRQTVWVQNVELGIARKRQIIHKKKYICKKLKEKICVYISKCTNVLCNYIVLPFFRAFLFWDEFIVPIYNLFSFFSTVNSGLALVKQMCKKNLQKVLGLHSTFVKPKITFLYCPKSQ